MQECTYATQCGYLQQCLINPVNPSIYDCIHDDIFPVSVYTSIVYAIMPPGIGTAILGGIGGGILKGPVVELMLNYYQAMATQISYCLMIGGCLINTVLLFFERQSINLQITINILRHPDQMKRPIINFDIAMIFNCAISLGTNSGIFLVNYLPQIVVLILEEIFLISLLPYLITKGLSLKREYYQKQQDLTAEILQVLKPFSSNATIKTSINEEEFDISKEVQEIRNNFEQRQNQKFPIYQLVVILTFFSITQLLLSMRATMKKKSIIGLKPCEVIDMVLIVMVFVVSIILTFGVYLIGKKVYFIMILLDVQVDAQKSLCSFQNDERYFNPKGFTTIYGAGFLAGLVSGMFGYGAGLVMVPAMLIMNVQPRVASSTSAFNYFWLSMNNLFSLLGSDLLSLTETYWFLFLAVTIINKILLKLIGGSVFAKIGYILMNKYKVSYMVVLIVAGLTIANLISNTAYVAIQSHRFGFDSLTKVTQGC